MEQTNLNRRQFLKACAAGTAATLPRHLLLAADTAPSRPNILWIICEDISTDFACFGRKALKTPNVDKFAAEGILFKNAFATGPVCSPSRSAFNTAMYQTTIAAHNHRSHRDDGCTLPAPVKLITEYFRSAGYFTCNCSEQWSRPGKTDFNFHLENPFDGLNWNHAPKGKPFFAQVNISNFDHEGTDPQNPVDPDSVQIPPYHPEHEITRLTWAQYLERVQLLDRKIAGILTRLERDGHRDNTIVFLFGDNGRQLQRGMQFLYDDGIHVPLIVRWPGKLKPALSDRLVSLIDIAPTSLALAGIEIPPHMHGRPFLGPNSAKRHYIVAARDRCDETVDRIRCVRTKQFKYIRNFYHDRPYTQPNLYKQHYYPILCLMKVLHAQGKLTPAQARFMADSKPPEELYDLLADPHEINNLAADPEYISQITEFRSILNKWISQTADQGRSPEPPSVAKDQYEKILLPRHRKLLKRRGLNENLSPTEYLNWWQKKLSSPPTCNMSPYQSKKTLPQIGRAF